MRPYQRDALPLFTVDIEDPEESTFTDKDPVTMVLKRFAILLVF
jgi:hypothetical protein